MSEPQYADYTDMPRQLLGVMANQVWLQDPRMLGIRLARYKFVAKMLVGKSTVAEVGCGDGWFSKLVGREVRTLHLYDFDDEFCRQNSFINKWDIVKNGELPDFRYDAIYSLDVMEHIERGNDIHMYLQNIKSSLTPSGAFIVGMPSLESQKYASPASHIGHKSCMSQDEFRKILSEYYHNVFVLGMNDEALHTGFGPMSHYHLGICTNVR